MSRWIGRALLAGLGVMLALNLVLIGRNWARLRAQVTTPPGTTAPDFTLPLLDGGRLHLAETRGAPVVLAFWATWCEPCKMELPHLDHLAHSLGGRARFFAVNIEDAGREPAVEAFVHSTGLSLEVAFGGEQVAETYHVDTIPHLVILDAEGQVRKVMDGLHSEGTIRDAIARASGSVAERR